jgi:hypothetical protein
MVYSLDDFATNAVVLQRRSLRSLVSDVLATNVRLELVTVRKVREGTWSVKALAAGARIAL